MKFKHTNLPIEQELPKLIRDKIPELIEKNEGRKAIVRKAKNDKEYLKFVLKKIVEEAVETQNSKTKEDFLNDICDIEELLDELKKVLGIKKGEVVRVRKLKAKKNGGFSKRLIFEGKE